MLGSESVPNAGAVQRKVKGLVPVALAFRVTVPPDATVYGPPALAVGAVHPVGGAMSLGHGLRIPTRVPAEDVYPPLARKSMVLKLFDTMGVPGTFSGKIYSWM